MIRLCCSFSCLTVVCCGPGHGKATGNPRVTLFKYVVDQTSDTNRSFTLTLSRPCFYVSSSTPFFSYSTAEYTFCKFVGHLSSVRDTPEPRESKTTLIRSLSNSQEAKKRQASFTYAYLKGSTTGTSLAAHSSGLISSSSTL